MSQAGIVDFIGTHPEIPTMFVANVGTAVPIANTIELLGASVAAHGVPLQTVASGNTVDFNIQYASGAVSSVAGNAGVASFDTASFTVDANGFVQLTATAGATQMQVDTFTAPGTNPVMPNGSGIITVTGGQVAAGTTANVIRTDSLAANTYTIQIQRSQAVASSTIGDNGVSHFNSTYFTVDANGFVSLSGSTVGQTITGNSGGALSPTAGNWNIFAAAVSAGTTPAATSGTGSTLTVNIQRSQAIASTNATNVGLAAFNSTYFTVDGNGFVSLSGSTVGQTITGNVGGALSPTAGNWNILGTSTAAGTTPVQTSGSVSTLTVQVQKAQAIGSTNATNVGLAAFNSTNFTVDANGFVSLSGTGALQTLSDDVGTVVTPSAGNIQLVGHVVEQGATKFSTVVAGSHLININPMSTARWIVDPLGFNGTHTTIASAITSATAGDTIYVMGGTYTENLTLKASVNLETYQTASNTGVVKLIGKMSYSGTGNVSVSGFYLQTNSDYVVEITGSSPSIVILDNVYINCANNTGLHNTSSNAAAQINVYNSNGDIATTGIALHTNASAGNISYVNTFITNSGNSTTASATSSGITASYWSGFGCAFSFSGSSVGGFTASSIIVPNGTAITTTGTSVVNCENCFTASGTASTFSIGSGTTLDAWNTIVNSTNTNAVAGSGNYGQCNVSYTGTGIGLAGTLTITTNISSDVTKVVRQVFTAGGTYTPTAGMKYADVICLGGGGAGGGAAATGGATVSGGAGGAAGEYAQGVFSKATIGTSQTVTIGAGGTGASGTTGGNGGTTSLGSLITALGGGGGATGAAGTNSVATGGVGGSGGSGGDFRSQGSYGFQSVCYLTPGTAAGGQGASSQYGSGGVSVLTNSAGNNATGYGAGGGGAANYTSQSARTGGNGSGGIVIITEYC